METVKDQDSLCFAVLVPHRDCLPPLDQYRRSLFAAGLAGAFSFPAAAPMALLREPLPDRTLKAWAAELRRLLGNRKIVSGPAAECAVGPEKAGTGLKGFRLFGPGLDLPPIEGAEAVFFRWEKPVLVSAILGPGDEEALAALNQTGPLPPALSFRAAALANLVLRPAPCGETAYSFTWETGPLFWLPKTGGSRG
jgi:hypothetical protein